MARERALQIKTPSGWKVAGKLLKVRGEWSFYREVTTRMMFRQFDAWSIQETLIPVLRDDGVAYIYQFVKDTGEMLRISLEDFLEKSVERDFGEGKQLYVSDKYFKRLKMKPIRKWIKATELVA